MPHWSEFDNTPITGPTAMSNIFDMSLVQLRRQTAGQFSSVLKKVTNQKTKKI